MNLINVKEQEWEAAEAFFQNQKNQEAVKFKARDQARDKAVHSFIRVGDEIFAIATKNANGHLLGEGGFGKVRMVQSKNGDNFAVKIEGRGIRGEHDTETKIMKILNYLKGEAVREFGSNKLFKGKITTQKLYTVTQLREGAELTSEIYSDLDPMSKKKLKPGEKLSIALNACKAVQVLHTRNIIHADIKPANFMANRKGEEILIESIDYGTSLIVTSPATEIKFDRIRGTEWYMAPEIEKGIYSYSSDIYALGTMLSRDLWLKNSSGNTNVIGDLVTKMKGQDPNKRPKLDEIISQLTLAKAIENIKNADEQSALSTIKTLLEPMGSAYQNYYANIALALMKEKKKENPPLITYLNNVKSASLFLHQFSSLLSQDKDNKHNSSLDNQEETKPDKKTGPPP